MEVDLEDLRVLLSLVQPRCIVCWNEAIRYADCLAGKFCFCEEHDFSSILKYRVFQALYGFAIWPPQVELIETDQAPLLRTIRNLVGSGLGPIPKGMKEL